MIKASVILVAMALGVGACSSSERLDRQVMSHTISEDGSGRYSSPTGQRLFVGAKGLTFAFDSSVGPELRPACRAAALTLNQSVGRELIKFSDVDRAYAARDGFNTISLAKVPRTKESNEAGEAYTYYDDAGLIIEADIDFKPLLVSTGADAESVCLHELGHAVGFAHVLDRGSFMFDLMLVGQSKRKPNAADLERLRTAYPVATAAKGR